MLKTQAQVRVVVSLAVAFVLAVGVTGTARAGEPGDANCDNVIDERDIDALIALIFGHGTFCTLADANGDNHLNAADLTALAGKLSGTVPTATPTNTGTITTAPDTATPTPTVGVVVGTPTRTPSPLRGTATPTSLSPTRTPTGLSPTRTPTSLSVTRTPTLVTGTATATPVATGTARFATRTPTFTITSTRTRTQSPTLTPSRTRPVTRTPTSIFSPTSTRTSTITRTPSSTRTVTLTATVTVTRTPSKTPTDTRSPTVTRTPTITKTPTNTRTFTLTPAPTSTRTPTNTRTPTIPPPFGPEITYFGVSRADGHALPDEDVTATPDGMPVYISQSGSGFRIIVETRDGRSGKDPSKIGTMGLEIDGGPRRAGLQVIVSMPLGIGTGLGSTAICDVPDPQNPNAPSGGVPAESEFDNSQMVTDAINDMACRFDTHDGSGEACTIDIHDNTDFVSPRSTKQFCSAPAVGIELTFQHGDTLVTGQVADTNGNIGNQKQFILRRP